MAVPFGPQQSSSMISSINPDPTPLRKRKEYTELCIELSDAIHQLMGISGDYNSRYQAEMEACEEISFLAFKLAQYIKKNAWEKPGDDNA